MPGHEHQIAPNDLRRPPSWPGEIRAEGAREAAKKATREADRAEAEARSIRMVGAGRRSPSPEIAQCLNGGYGWLEVKCRRCETYASIQRERICRRRDTRYGSCVQMPSVADAAVLARRPT